MLRTSRIHNFNTLALLLLTGVALLSTWSCGGQSGGAPSGIAAALVNAKLKIGSFDIAVAGGSPFTGTPPPTNPLIVGIQGALYPAQYSKSFRVTISGAGADLSDVVYDIDLTSGTTQAAGGHGTVQGQIQLAVGQSPVDNQLYYYPVTTNKQGQFVYVDTSAINPNGGSTISSNSVYSTSANIYLSSTAAAIRAGARNVVVEFYTDPTSVAEVKDPIYTASTPPPPSESVITYRATHITNIYVFTANIAPQNGQVDLSAGFASDNGTNGPIDSAKYKVQIDAVPQDAQSIVIQAYEQPVGLIPTPLVFSKVVDKAISGGSGTAQDPDSTWPVTPSSGVPVNVSSEILVANQQEPLKLYVTAWSQPNGQGLLLGSTYEDDNPNHYLLEPSAGQQTPGQIYPIVFTPAPNAFVGNATTLADSPSNYIFEMGLAPTLSNLVLLNSTLGTTSAAVTAASSVTPQFQATQTTYTFVAPNVTQLPPNSPYTTSTVSVPNSLLTFTAPGTTGAWPVGNPISSAYWAPTTASTAAAGVVTGPISSLNTSTGTVSWGGTSFSPLAFESAAGSSSFYLGTVNVFGAQFNPADGTVGSWPPIVSNEPAPGNYPPTYPAGTYTYAIPITPNLGFVGGGTIN